MDRRPPPVETANTSWHGFETQLLPVVPGLQLPGGDSLSKGAALPTLFLASQIPPDRDSNGAPLGAAFVLHRGSPPPSPSSSVSSPLLSSHTWILFWRCAGGLRSNCPVLSTGQGGDECRLSTRDLPLQWWGELAHNLHAEPTSPRILSFVWILLYRKVKNREPKMVQSCLLALQRQTQNPSAQRPNPAHNSRHVEANQKGVGGAGSVGDE